MHRLLETYLSEVSAHLGALPPKRHAEELREMRAHLENAIVVSHELGRSEAEAAANAVAQFGTARDLGENLVWAWKRGRRKDRRSFWGAVALTPLTLLGLMLAISHLPDFRIPWLDSYCATHEGSGEVIGMALSEAMFLTAFGLAGVVAGSLSPKRAVRAACLGLTVFFVGWAVLDGKSGLPDNWERGAWVLAAVASAWATGRRRVKRARTAL